MIFGFCENTRQRFEPIWQKNLPRGEGFGAKTAWSVLNSPEMRWWAAFGRGVSLTGHVDAGGHC